MLRHDDGDKRHLDHFPRPFDTAAGEQQPTRRALLHRMDDLLRRLQPVADKRLLPSLARFLRRTLLRRGGFEAGQPRRATAPRTRVASPQRIHRGEHLPHLRRQPCHGRFQRDHPLLLRGDHAFLPGNRFVLGNDQPDQLVAAGILQVNHDPSIPPPLIPEQIRC